MQDVPGALSPLTKSQVDGAIDRFLNRHGRLPSARELREVLGRGSYLFMVPILKEWQDRMREARLS